MRKSWGSATRKDAVLDTTKHKREIIMWQFIKDTWDRYWNEPDPAPEPYPVIPVEALGRRGRLRALRKEIIKARRQKKKSSHLEAEAKEHRDWLLERGY